MTVDVTGFREGAEEELTNHILPWWITFGPDKTTGRWAAELDHQNNPVDGANEGLILNARLLWTFAAAYRAIPDTRYLEMAERARQVLDGFFADRELGGAYWALDRDGFPVDDQKLLYGQAFWVYGLTEFALATGTSETYTQAMNLWRLVDSQAHDETNLGFFENFNRDWSLRANGRLSDADLAEPKSMNAHLHVLEALTNLARLNTAPEIIERLDETILVFERHIIRPDSRSVGMFFLEDWTPRDNHRSFGHEIEVSWLLSEAAEVLEGSPSRVAEVCVELAGSVLKDGIDDDGGLFYERDTSAMIDSDKHWWPQAEAAVGFLNAYQLSKEERFLDASWRSWCFIQKNIVNREHGEWYWAVHRDGTPDLTRPKLAAWKAPYHNTRMCIELIRRLGTLETTGLLPRD